MSDRRHDGRPGDAGDGEDPPDDPFHDFPALRDLRERLAAYYRAAEAEETPRRRRWRAPRLPPRARPALPIALTLLMAGAAAAAVTLSLKRSAPLSGRVPPVAGAARWGFGFTEAGERYRIAFAPMLTAGDAGWRSFVYVGRAGRQGSIGTPGGYPTAGLPLLSGAGNYVTAGSLRGKIVRYVLTGPAVAAVEVGTQTAQTIETRASAALPATDRIAVFMFPTAVEHLRQPRRPSPRLDANPIAPRAGTRRELTPLDRRGTPIAIASTESDEYAPRLPTRAWRRRTSTSTEDAAGQPQVLTRGACALKRRGLPSLTPERAEVALALRPVENAVGELLLSCLQATYALRGSQLQAAILLNAGHPGSRPPGPIPGARPVNGRPGTVNAVLGPTPGDITARREGRAWLVVEGGRSLAQRLEVLDALRIAKVSASRARKP